MLHSRKALSPEQINAQLLLYPAWELQGDVLFRAFKFDDFSAAWAFMQQVAQIAETLDHHPDWRNVYDLVEIRLSTHECNGISALDFEMIRKIELLGS